ncbi:MAG: hypothetical protein IPL10_03625 [Bacteroidetes bacterium]|nr:hypothetical protein [Bacteroidota bacterium]
MEKENRAVVGDETAYSIKICANGNLLISGLKDLRGSPQQGPFIMRLDTSGTILWQNYYPSATYANGSFDVMEMPNGDIVFIGDSIFSREYRILPNSQNYFRDIVQAPDKGYCFSGFVSPMNGDGGTQDIWLLKTDSTLL